MPPKRTKKVPFVLKKETSTGRYYFLVEKEKYYLPAQPKEQTHEDFLKKVKLFMKNFKLVRKRKVTERKPRPSKEAPKAAAPGGPPKVVDNLVQATSGTLPQTLPQPVALPVDMAMREELKETKKQLADTKQQMIEQKAKEETKTEKKREAIEGVADRKLLMAGEHKYTPPPQNPGPPPVIEELPSHRQNAQEALLRKRFTRDAEKEIREKYTTQTARATTMKALLDAEYKNDKKALAKDLGKRQVNHISAWEMYDTLRKKVPNVVLEGNKTLLQEIADKVKEYEEAHEKELQEEEEALEAKDQKERDENKEHKGPKIEHEDDEYHDEDAGPFSPDPFVKYGFVPAPKNQEGEGLRQSGLRTSEIDAMMGLWSGYLNTIARNDVTALKPISRTEPGGFVMNLDRKDQPGSHWVSVYCDPTHDRSIEYYDPFGDRCPDDINEGTIKWLSDQIDLPSQLKFKENLIKNQSVSNENCGWHAMNFLRQRIAGTFFTDATGYYLKKTTDVKAHEEQVKKLKEKYPVFGYV